MRIFHRFCLALLTLSLAAPVHASAVVIWPVDPEIAPGARSAALWLENRGTEPVTLQVRSLGWSQAGGSDDYARQDEIVASPPMAEVAPGKRQLVRIVRRDPADPAGERSYRLLIDEVPAPHDGGADGAASARLAVQMRYSIPLFSLGAAVLKAEPDLETRIVSENGGRYAEIRNRGARHARLTDLRSTGAKGAIMLKAGLVGYVLPGATMRWALPETMPAGGALLAGVNGKDQPLGALL